MLLVHVSFFFFNDTATTEIYTLSLHDALPICAEDFGDDFAHRGDNGHINSGGYAAGISGDRKSTRLNSSHTVISYAVFCLKKKKNKLHDCNSRKKYSNKR